MSETDDRAMTAPTSEQIRALAADQPPRLTDGQCIAQVKLALFAAADQLEAVRQEVSNYAGWYEYSPEHSWRFERDLRAALGMEQYSGDDDA